MMVVQTTKHVVYGGNSLSKRFVLPALAALVVLVALAVPALASGILNFRTHLSGQNEVPARATLAQGQVTFQLNADGTELSYRLNTANITNVFQAHIHLGPAGANGPIVVWLYPSAPPPVSIPGRSDGVLATGTITAANLTGPLAGQPLSALIDAIEAGNTYVNVHTNDFVDPTNTGPGDFPGGEIRGQVQD